MSDGSKNKSSSNGSVASGTTSTNARGRAKSINDMRNQLENIRQGLQSQVYSGQLTRDEAQARLNRAGAAYNAYEEKIQETKRYQRKFNSLNGRNFANFDETLNAIRTANERADNVKYSRSTRTRGTRRAIRKEYQRVMNLPKA